MDEKSKPETKVSDKDGKTLATVRAKFEGKPLPEGGWPKADWELEKGEQVLPPS